MKKLALAFLAAAGCSPSAPSPELHVFNWSDYFDPAVLKAFEKEYGCTVVYDTFDSPEALRAKLDHVPSGYDVVFPSDEILPALAAEGKLEKLDPAKLPNFKNIAPAFKGLACDPKNEYSVPYMWGTTGVAYDRKEVSPAPDSWGAIFDPARQDKLSILEDPREVFAAAFRLEGADLANLTPELIEKAKKRILGVKPRAIAGQPQKLLIQGDVVLAHCYSGDAAQASAERKGAIGYAIPREGGTLWFDNICIAKGSKQAELAHRFVDFLMRPDIAAANTNFKRYPSPNEAARGLIKKEILENPIIYPSEADLKRCRVLGEMKPELRKLLMDAWAEIKAK